MARRCRNSKGQFIKCKKKGAAKKGAKKTKKSAKKSAMPRGGTRMVCFKVRSSKKSAKKGSRKVGGRCRNAKGRFKKC